MGVDRGHAKGQRVCWTCSRDRKQVTSVSRSQCYEGSVSASIRIYGLIQFECYSSESKLITLTLVRHNDLTADM